MSKTILVVNGSSYASSVAGLGEVTSRVRQFVKDPKSFDLVLFTGGADVSPVFYGDTSPKGMCYINTERDLIERTIFKTALANGVLMTGICRGLQFLNVMAGGRMMHDLQGHGMSNHFVRTITGELFLVNSLHHQMILPADNAHVLAWSEERLSRSYIGAADEVVDYQGQEIEAAVFPTINAFGVQYHPEMMATQSEGYVYYHGMVKNALSLEWPDFIKMYVENPNGRQLVDVPKRDRSAAK